MTSSKFYRCAGFVLLTAAVASGAIAAIGNGQVFPLLRPLSPTSEELAPADDNVVLFQPHDGSFESGFSFFTDEELGFQQFFLFPSENGRLLAFEACFLSLAVTVPNFQFEFQYYSASQGGEEAEPGTLRENVESPFFDVPGGQVTCQVINFIPDAGDIGIDVSDFAAYLGVEWDGELHPTILLAVDSNGENTSNGWGRVNDLVGEWLPLRFTPPFNQYYRNLGIATVWAGATPGGTPLFNDGFESGDTSAWSDTLP